MLQELFDEINEEHFQGQVPAIPVVWSPQLRQTAGRCRYMWARLPCGSKQFRLRDIRLNPHLLRDHPERLHHILAHEMVHAWLINTRGETGHTPRFHRKMTEITGENKNHRLHSYDTKKIVAEKAKWVIHCPSCGKDSYRLRIQRRHQRSPWVCGCGQKTDIPKLNRA